MEISVLIVQAPAYKFGTLILRELLQSQLKIVDSRSLSLSTGQSLRLSGKCSAKERIGTVLVVHPSAIKLLNGFANALCSRISNEFKLDEQKLRASVHTSQSVQLALREADTCYLLPREPRPTVPFVRTIRRVLIAGPPAVGPEILNFATAFTHTTESQARERNLH